MPSEWLATVLYFGVVTTGPEEEWLAATQGVVHTSLAGLALLLLVVAAADLASRSVSSLERFALLLATLPRSRARWGPA
jgi:hypothetical protein